jgi:excisionase family DNA binding protein
MMWMYQTDTKFLGEEAAMGALLNAKQVQDRLGISESTFLRLLKRKELTGFKVGREWRFEESDINVYIERQRRRVEGLEPLDDEELDDEAA